MTCLTAGLTDGMYKGETPSKQQKAYNNNTWKTD